MKTETIKQYAGITLGTIVTETSGKRVAKQWAGRDLGWFDPHMGFNGATYSIRANRYIAEGDVTSALVWAQGNL